MNEQENCKPADPVESRDLTPEQQRRVYALQAARSILAADALFTKGAVQVDPVIELAEWILYGFEDDDVVIRDEAYRFDLPPRWSFPASVPTVTYGEPVRRRTKWGGVIQTDKTFLDKQETNVEDKPAESPFNKDGYVIYHGKRGVIDRRYDFDEIESHVNTPNGWAVYVDGCVIDFPRENYSHRTLKFNTRKHLDDCALDTDHQGHCEVDQPNGGTDTPLHDGPKFTVGASVKAGTVVQIGTDGRAYPVYI